MREAHERDDVETHLALLALDVELGEAADGAEAGVVHEQVGRALVHLRLDAREVGGIGEIGGERARLDAALAGEALGERVQPLGVARHQHEVVVVAREPLREGAADAGRSARHERAAPRPSRFALLRHAREGTAR